MLLLCGIHTDKNRLIQLEQSSGVQPDLSKETMTELPPLQKCYSPGPAKEVFKVRGPVTISLKWQGAGAVGVNLAVQSLWLFRTVRLLNLSLVIVERSHVYKFQATEKYLSPAEPDYTCRTHQ